MDIMINFRLSKMWPGIPPLKPFHTWWPQGITTRPSNEDARALKAKGWSEAKMRICMRIAAKEANEDLQKLVESR